MAGPLPIAAFTGCLATFTRKNGKVGCLRYNIEEDRMEVVGDIHNNREIKVFQTFAD